MFKLLLGLLKGGDGRKSVAGNLAWEIREAIKGKELDPNEIIELQTKINEIEAGHRTVFVAGWRPFIGWVCGVALAYNFAIRDLFIDSYLSLPSTKDEVRRIATQAIKEKGGDKNTYFPLAALDSKTIQEIKKLFPQSKKLHNKIREQGTFSLSSELLWHSDRGHGVKRVENGERLGEDDKSQRPVLFKDYEKIPGILREPDTVNYGAGTTKRRGWTTIEYRKRIDDELHVLIMAILTGQRKVVAHNMYIKKKPSSRK